MIKPSKIGLGTFPFSSVFSSVNEAAAKSIVETFMASGGFYIDTAPIYAFGDVELLMGKLLRKFSRDKFSLISKCGWIWGEDKKPRLSGKRQDVIDECNKSLDRLGVGHIDIYMSHVPDTNTSFEETIDALAWLRSEGKIKEIGVSNVSLEQLKEYNKSNQIRFIQNRFSLINRSYSPEFLSYCKENDIGIIPYQVIERGILTENASNLRFRDNDLRNKKPEFAVEKRSILVEWVENNLKPLAESAGTSVEAMTIWWTINQPCVAFPICGATNVKQLKTNFEALKINNSNDLLAKIDLKYTLLENEIREKFSMTVPSFMGLV